MLETDYSRYMENRTHLDNIFPLVVDHNMYHDSIKSWRLGKKLEEETIQDERTRKLVHAIMPLVFNVDSHEF